MNVVLESALNHQLHGVNRPLYAHRDAVGIVAVNIAAPFAGKLLQSSPRRVETDGRTDFKEELNMLLVVATNRLIATDQSAKILHVS